MKIYLLFAVQSKLLETSPVKCNLPVVMLNALTGVELCGSKIGFNLFLDGQEFKFVPVLFFLGHKSQEKGKKERVQKLRHG